MTIPKPAAESLCRLSILLLLSFSVFGQKDLPKKISITSIDSIVNQAARIFMADTARKSLSIGVFDHGKQYTYHFGKTKTDIPTDKSIYEIGSITKTMTGTALAQAVTDGKVKLDDDIRKYLDSSYPNLEYNGNPIRLFQLLNHSSGLPFDLPKDEKIAPSYSRADFYKDLHEIKLDTIPGIKLNYSNSAAQLLGYILEKVYNEPFEKLLERFIFKPLKMSSSSFSPNAAGRQYQLNGYDKAGKIASPNLSGAAGGIRSDVLDMLHYLRFEMNEKNPVVALSHQPTWGDIQYYAMGLNWQMDHRKGNPRRIFQSGGTKGFSSNLTLYPELETGVILLSNEAGTNTQDDLSKAAQLIFSVLHK